MGELRDHRQTETHHTSQQEIFPQSPGNFSILRYTEMSHMLPAESMIFSLPLKATFKRNDHREPSHFPSTRICKWVYSTFKMAGKKIAGLSG
jgi:hypothetical protein